MKLKIDPSKKFYTLCHGDILETIDALNESGEKLSKPGVKDIEKISSLIENAIPWNEYAEIAIREILGGN